MCASAHAQTFDGDGVAIDGAIDDYSGKVVVTKAMGEGAIEGVAADYKLPAGDPFSTKFKCDRTCTCTYMRTCAHAHMHTCTYTHGPFLTKFKCGRVHMHMHTCIYMHSHIHTCTRTCT